MNARARMLLAAWPLCLLWPDARHFVEGRMAMHMLVEFPLLLAAGWAAAAWLPHRLERALAGIDAHGLASATFASLVAAFWMIPAALDWSLLSAVAAWLKVATWFIAGLMLAGGWIRLTPVVAAFFLGNAAWMLATAGLLYREAEARLCVSYLFDEQAWAGSGLVAWALVLGGLAWHQFRPRATLSAKQPG